MDIKVRLLRHLEGARILHDPLPRVGRGAAGNGRWAKLDGGALPEGRSFYRYVDGGKVSGTAPSGRVDFYATWIENKEYA